MLSRVADSLYWMSRYLERAEHCARLIDVHLNLMLDQSPESAEHRWRRVWSFLGDDASVDASTAGAHTLTHALTFDTANRSSIVSCILSTRDNAQQVREQISSEMWEQINRLFHQVRRAGSEDIPDVQPLEFLSAVREGAHLFHGLSDSTMNHGEGWQFIQTGRFMERANATAALLDVHFRDFSSASEFSRGAGDFLEWIGLLRSCAAFEAYCKVNTAGISRQSIAEFLILNPEFPHSVRYSVDMLHAALVAIPGVFRGRHHGKLEALTGRLRASLTFTHVEEILSSGLHGYLSGIQRQCSQVHQEIQQVYINYPVESAIEA